MNNPNERLLFFRTEVLNMSRREFCDPLVMSESELRNIEVRGIDLKDKQLRQICEVYGVRPEWLADGVEPIRREESDSFKIGAIAGAAAQRRPEEAARFFQRFIEDFGEDELLVMYEIFRKRFPQYDREGE